MSYSRNLRRARTTGIYIGPTKSHSSPVNSSRGCLCLDKNTYDVSCCEGFLQQQGIGQTQSAQVVRGGFSYGFSTGFDIGERV
tara:strand:- start:735 stop:983 length:249 start_codon:yes stop_codon:yes gene_type:complete